MAPAAAWAWPPSNWPVPPVCGFSEPRAPRGASSSSSKTAPKPPSIIASRGYLDAIKAATNGKGLDIILEMAAHQNLGHDLTLLARRGRVVVIGSRGPVQIDPRNIMTREADIIGITLFSPTPELRTQIYQRIRAGLEDRSLNPVIGQAFPLREAARAHEQIMTSAARGKIVLTM